MRYRYHQIITIRNNSMNGFKLHFEKYNKVIVNVANIKSIYSYNRKKCQVHLYSRFEFSASNIQQLMSLLCAATFKLGR